MSYYSQQPYTQDVDSIGGMKVQYVDILSQNYDPNEDMGWYDPHEYMSGGEYLVRDGSSGGSSYDSRSSTGYGVYGSPPGTVDPALIQYDYDYDYDYDVYGSSTSPDATPRNQPGHSRHSSSNVPICCDQCDSQFKRRADLKRHKDHIHNPTNLALIYCDYPKCPRSTDPFKRKDHFRDHVREYHCEDVERRGVQVSDEWYKSRNMCMGWWRCVKCLNRVVIKQSGFNCPDCGGSAGKRRQEARRRH